MEDTAEHLVRNVFPNVPVRQWVLSFPRRVRFLAARHPALVSRLLDLFTRAVFAWQRRCADLLKKVFAIDVLACPDCDGRLELIAFIAEATIARRILDHLGLDSQGPPVDRAQPPPRALRPWARL